MDSYDYIVIGAGSAGCTLASRLSEDPDTTVLLLEAGPSDDSWAVHMPAAMGQVIGGKRFDWRYHSGPEPYLDGRTIVQPRGLGLGGSSSINGMMFVRGHARDYDRWAEERGCPGWSYREVLPYFRRSETYEGGADPYHGDSGPLRASHGDVSAPLQRAFLEAGQEAGYGLTEDFNGYRQEGFGRYDRTIWGGERWSTAKGALSHTLTRLNVTTLTGALVTRILFEGRRAAGIEYAQGSALKSARAEREIILAAGAINSPQLLMLSGVGPADHLREHAIEVLRDLPGVGRNLSDHPDVVLQYECARPVTIYPWTKAPRKWFVGLQWFLSRKGLAASNQFDAGAFLRSRAGIPHPDLQLTFMSACVIPGTTKMYPGHAFQVHVDLLRPTSIGELTLISGEPHRKPRIVFNYLKSEEDRAALRASARLVREVLEQPSFKPFLGRELTPGPEAQSDDALDAWARQLTETGYHPVGSCKMGPSNDPMAVVDPELRVYGLEGLRVVDASIMPDLVSGNTNAPTVMIAEKASDMILGRQAPAPSNAPVWSHPDWENRQR